MTRWRHKKRGTVYTEIRRVTLVSGSSMPEGLWVLVLDRTAIPAYPEDHAEPRWLLAELQAAQPVAAGTKLVVYQAEDDGKCWARPRAEFEDGRFERVA